MEKRLFLALILSFLVLYMFQGTRAPKPGAESLPPQQVAEEVSSPQEITSSPNAAAEPFEEIIHDLAAANLSLRTSNRGGVIAAVRTELHDYTFPISQIVSLQAFKEFAFHVQSAGEDFIVYELAHGGWRIEKRYEVSGDFLIQARITLENVSPNPQSLDANVNAFVIPAAGDDGISSQERGLFEYSALMDGKVIRKANAQKFSEKNNVTTEGAVKWVGFRDRYFALIVDPLEQSSGYRVEQEGEDILQVGFIGLDREVPAGEQVSWSYQVYAGPQDLGALSIVDRQYEKIFVFSNWAIMDVIAKGIHQFVRIVHNVVPNWGLAIIITAIVIYFAIYPLTAKSMASMKRMQSLQPKMAELKLKHKDSPEKLNKEMMELYRREKVNPLGGCLPMLLQMPIFIGLYQVLWRSVYLKGANFLWIEDLSEPDRLIYPLPFDIPFLGNAFNLLPVLMMVVMMVQQRISAKNMGKPTDPAQATQQKMMQTIFPVFLGVIFYKFASGLTLYFTVFYLLTTLTQWKMASKGAVK